MNDVSSAILSATLTHEATLPFHTTISYWLSNDGGARWWIVRPGEEFVFPTPGNDARWRAELRSSTPLFTPVLSRIRIQTTVEGLLGDVNDDQRVNPIDLLRILQVWKETVSEVSPEDVHPNGAIDPLDLVLFQSIWYRSLLP